MQEEKLKSLINIFFTITKELRQEGLFRSDKYLGDIGESICAHLYDLTLCESGREEGHDATKNGEKYQIKFQNSDTKTNFHFGNPDKYKYVLLVVGPSCKIKRHQGEKVFAIYKFTAEHVRTNFRRNSGYMCGSESLPSEPDNVFSYEP